MRGETIQSWEERAERSPDERPTAMLLAADGVAAKILAESPLTREPDHAGLSVVAGDDLSPDEFGERVSDLDLVVCFAAMLESGSESRVASAGRAAAIASKAGTPTHLLLPEQWLASDNGTRPEATEGSLERIANLEESYAVTAAYAAPEHVPALIADLADRVRADQSAQSPSPGTSEYQEIVRVLGPGSIETDADPSPTASRSPSSTPSTRVRRLRNSMPPRHCSCSPMILSNGMSKTGWDSQPTPMRSPG